MPDFSRFAAEYLKPFTTPELGRLYNGYITLRMYDGGHRTFRIRTGYPGTKFSGKRIIGILIGPENSTDYDDFGFIEPNGIRIFKRVLGTMDEASSLKKYADILWRMSGGEQVAGYEVLESRHCLRCNRILTDPESIMLGIGPTCREKM